MQFWLVKSYSAYQAASFKLLLRETSNIGHVSILIAENKK